MCFRTPSTVPGKRFFPNRPIINLTATKKIAASASRAPSNRWSPQNRARDPSIIYVLRTLSYLTRIYIYIHTCTSVGNERGVTRSPSSLDTITTGMSTFPPSSTSILNLPAPSSTTIKLCPPELLTESALARKLQAPRRTRTCAPFTLHGTHGHTCARLRACSQVARNNG